MKLHPQSAEQIRAFLSGRRTQVRVPCIDQTARDYRWVENHWTAAHGKPYTGWVKETESSSIPVVTDSPLGNPGDIVCFTCGDDEVKREIVSVRVERLRAIIEADAVAEGFVFHYPTGNADVIRFAQGRQPTLRDPSTASAAFSKLWDRDHPNHPFSSNPWVWRYEVKDAT